MREKIVKILLISLVFYVLSVMYTTSNEIESAGSGIQTPQPKNPPESNSKESEDSSPNPDSSSSHSSDSSGFLSNPSKVPESKNSSLPIPSSSNPTKSSHESSSSIPEKNDNSSQSNDSNSTKSSEESSSSSIPKKNEASSQSIDSNSTKGSSESSSSSAKPKNDTEDTSAKKEPESKDSEVDNKEPKNSSDTTESQMKDHKGSDEASQSTKSEIPRSELKIKLFSDSQFLVSSFFKTPKISDFATYYLKFTESDLHNSTCKSQPEQQIEISFDKKKNEKKIKSSNCTLEYFKKQFTDTYFASSLPMSQTTSEIILSPGEFALFKCSNNNETLFEYNPLIPRLPKSQSVNPSRNVLLLSFSSLSRAQAHNKLNSSLSFLAEHALNKNSSFLDFSFRSIPSIDDAEDASQLLYGYSLQFIQSLKRNSQVTYSHSHTFYDELEQKQAIWQVFEANGFKTLVLYDKFPSNLENTVRPKINADYKITNYWETTYYNKTCERDKRYEAIFDQTKNFWVQEQNESKFALVHFSADQIENEKEFDYELKDFLQNLIEFEDEEQEFVIFLLSDHGVEDLKVKNMVQGYFERIVPISVVYANSAFDISEKSLGNTEKVVTSLDFYHSLREIAGEVKGIKNDLYEIEKVFNVLSDEVTRKECRDIDDFGYLCPMVKYEYVDQQIKINIEKELEKFVSVICPKINITDSSIFEVDIGKNSESLKLFEAFFKLNNITAKAYIHSTKQDIKFDSIFSSENQKIMLFTACLTSLS